MFKLAPVIVLLAATIAIHGLQRSPNSPRTLHVSTDGDDANPGTVDRPFRTIQRGADELRFGDNLVIAGGTYRENVALCRSGIYLGRGITIQAAEGQRVEIVGNDLPDGATQRRAVFDTNHGDHLTIRRIHVRGSSYLGIAITGSWNITMEDCSSSDTPEPGIHIDKSHKVRVYRCRVIKACHRGGEESVSI